MSSLDVRMKSYEYINRTYLPRRSPIIIRIDGKAFHTFTKGMYKPFDDILIAAMQNTAKRLCQSVMNCKLAYTQSDEISLLLVDYENVTTEPWFANNVQKMASVAASMATCFFNQEFKNAFEQLKDVPNVCISDLEKYEKKFGSALFDARVFMLPKDEVCNYFIWRQQDASRNSIQAVAQNIFSCKEIQSKNTDELQEMIYQKTGENWNDLPTRYKRGSCILKKDITIHPNPESEIGITRGRWLVDLDIPLFTQDRNYINQWVIL